MALLQSALDVGDELIHSVDLKVTTVNPGNTTSTEVVHFVRRFETIEAAEE